MGKIEKIIIFTFIISVIFGFYYISTNSDKNNKIEKEKRTIYLEENKNIIFESEKKYDIQSRKHIKPGEKVEKYSTNPPTSGPHENAEKGGFYGDGLVDEKGVHNLEHGYVWITYKDITKDDILSLEKLSKDFLGSVVISERNKNDFKGLALASWGNLMKIKKFDRIVIEDFILRNKNKSPERIAR